MSDEAQNVFAYTMTFRVPQNKNCCKILVFAQPHNFPDSCLLPSPYAEKGFPLFKKPICSNIKRYNTYNVM